MSLSPFPQIVAPASPEVARQQLRDALARMPQAAVALEVLIEARLLERREVYEAQPASELNRGRVLELRAVLSFLRTGDFANA